MLAYWRYEDSSKKTCSVGHNPEFSICIWPVNFFFNRMHCVYFHGITTGKYWLWGFIEIVPLCWDSSSGHVQRGLL